MLAQKAIVIYAESAGAAHSFPPRPSVRAPLPTAVEVTAERPGGKNKTGSEATEMQESGKERRRWRRALPLVTSPPAVAYGGGGGGGGGIVVRRKRNGGSLSAGRDGVSRRSQTRFTR